MKIDIVLILLIIFSILWIILHLSDRRRIVNGFVFALSLASLLTLMLYIGLKEDIVILRVIPAIIILLFILLIPIFFVYGVIKLITSGIELIKKEGMSLSNSLSFVLGLMIMISIFIYPFVIEKVGNKFLRIILNFSMNIFIFFTIGFIVYLLSSLIYNFYYYKKDKDYIIVLGSGLNKDKVTPLLAGRVDRAISFYDTQIGKNAKRARLVMSGGQGVGELIPEAHAMKEYAVSKGIPEVDIICEDKSTTTKENLLNSVDMIEKDSNKDITQVNVIFATSNYHVFRTALLAKELDLNINGIGSFVKIYFYISAIIREYIGSIWMKRKLNSIILFLILIYTLAMEYFLSITI